MNTRNDAVVDKELAVAGQMGIGDAVPHRHKDINARAIGKACNAFMDKRGIPRVYDNNINDRVRFGSFVEAADRYASEHSL